MLDVHGIQILDRHPVFGFGDGGCGKSLLSLWIGGELQRRGLMVLYVDWELSAEDHRDRLERLFGDDMPAMLYARCARPRPRRLIGCAESCASTASITSSATRSRLRAMADQKTRRLRSATSSVFVRSAWAR